MSQYALVIVEWLDSRSPDPRWQHGNDLPDGLSIVKCASAGWLLREDEEIVAVAANIGDIDDVHNYQVSGVITIPSVCVTSIKRLVEA